MSDEDVRALFRRVDDGPPLGIDVHDVVARGRRVRARRTRLAVAGSALTVAAAAVVVVGLSVGGEVRSPDLERPATPPSVRSTSPAPPPPPARTAHPGETQPGPPESAGGTGAPPAVPGAGQPLRGSG